DPKINSFKKINKINYDTMLEMASSGSKVLDYRATMIAKNFNTKILSKSSTKPYLSGTTISNIETDTISICTTDNLNKITIVFSNEEKFIKIIKIVINSINKYKFYNLTYKDNKIEFFIEQKNKLFVINELSSKLKLLN
ncbi:MAG: hypothetical protein IJW32_03985, partial [Clostridia bacterium]|nr:hypothetical protein [Clostridia bacterium]